MTFELRLQQVLNQYNLNRHGIEQKIARSCGLHRHTIGKIYRNEAKNPSLHVISKICGWLIENGVPPDILPGALLGFKPARLWQAIGKTSKVTICLGMYKHIINKNNSEKPGPAHLTVASHDATANSKINQLLTSKEEMGNSRPTVQTRHVPFHFHRHNRQVEESLFKEDMRSTELIYQEVLDQAPMDNVILIGSQRANYLVEHFVANLFGCSPFTPVSSRPKVPLYLRYRTYDRPVPSCFGGRDIPPGAERKNKCGIWFLNKNGGWQLHEWEKNERDSGAVITVRSADAMQIALFGFSGRSTNAICNELIQRPENFWPEHGEEFGAEETFPGNRTTNKRMSKKKSPLPNTVVRNSKEIGVYICQVEFSKSDNDAETWKEKDCDNDIVTVEPLDRSALEKHLPKRRQSKGGKIRKKR